MVFDPEEWTPRAILAVSVALLITVLLAAGFYIDFIPAAGLYGRRAAIVFGVIGLLLSIWMYGVLFVRTPFAGILYHAGWKAWLGVLLTPFFFGLLVWLLLIKVGPWAMTRTFGVDHHEQVVMRTERRYSRHGCDHLLRGGPFEATTPDYFCISEDYYLRFPDRAVIVDLKGKATRFGFAVTSVHHVSAIDDPNAD